MGVEPENLLRSVPHIRGATDFLEFHIRLKEWLGVKGKGVEFREGLEEHSEYAFWDGCFLKDSGEWELANEYLRTSLAGSLGRRMRFITLQNMAWCCVKLEQWDDALALYDELRRFAKIPDSREKAAECAGYIAALRDFEIVPDREFQLAPSPRECEELDILTEANEILASKIVSYQRPSSTLQKLIDESKSITNDIRKCLSEELGSVVDRLPSEVILPLVEAKNVTCLEVNPLK